MSSFIVSNKTIGRALFPLQNADREQSYRTQEREIVACALGISPEDPQFLETLSLAMAELNERAVNARYKIKESIIGVKVRIEPTTLIQAYKSLGCWLYQCSEGDIPETSPLWMALQQVTRLWEGEIVASLPDYKKAEWD